MEASYRRNAALRDMTRAGDAVASPTLTAVMFDTVDADEFRKYLFIEHKESRPPCHHSRLTAFFFCHVSAQVLHVCHSTCTIIQLCNGSQDTMLKASMLIIGRLHKYR